MKYRKTLNNKILLNEIDVYCATMANFWQDKSDPMYTESKSAIYTIFELMVYYMGYDRKDLYKYAVSKLNSYCVSNEISDYITDEAEKEFCL
mgnify:CR=1 FL=1